MRSEPRNYALICGGALAVADERKLTRSMQELQAHLFPYDWKRSSPRTRGDRAASESLMINL
jgi:hypothetical protein